MTKCLPIYIISEFDFNLALMIGINRYQNGISPLETTSEEAEAIADILAQDYPSIIDDQAIKQTSEQFLKR